MFLILKLVLIILLNQMYAYISHDIQTVLLPAMKPIGAKEISLPLKIFGKQIYLNLRRNNQTLSSVFKIWKQNASIMERLSQLNASDHCYHLHKDHISTAAINFCQQHGWEGFVFLKDETLEIRPLWDDFAAFSLIKDYCVKEESNTSLGKSHLIKRSLQLFTDLNFNNLDNFKLKQRPVRNIERNLEEKLTIELAIFIDEAAYLTFKPFLNEINETNENLVSIMLAYVNRIQAIYQHPSLGVSIDISLVHFEIMEKQPSNLPVDRDSDKLHDSFCDYAKPLNPPGDNDPRHWDIGLYLTGINIHFQNNSSELGIAYTNSICKPDKSCAVVEFGIANELTSGFTSSLTAAHEIGHILGMRDDKIDEYIMAPKQYHQGQITWSEYSRNIASKLWLTRECLRDRTKAENINNKLDHSRYHNLPGRIWTAKAQCEIFFRDKNANVVSLRYICKTLQCETPNGNRNYFTGAALEGTYCARGKECRGGECVPVIEPPYIFNYCEEDYWSEWKEDSCKSSCLMNSKGARVKRRSCEHRKQEIVYRAANCKEPYYDVILCNDSSLCTKKRQTINSFTNMKCKEFDEEIKSRNLEFRLEAGPGWQPPHDFGKPWIACTIHCRKKNIFDKFVYYAPYLELLNFGIDPSFPDGTWCHKQDDQNYYCQQHYCLPERYS